MAKSSRKQRRKERGLVVTLIVLIAGCLGLLMKVAGYDVNDTFAVYAVVSIIIYAVLLWKYISTSEFLTTQKRVNIKLIKENAALIRENKNLKNEYSKDWSTLSEELIWINQQRNIADRTAKVYQQKVMELQEILDNIMKSYPELKAEEEAYKAQILENQEVAQKTYKEICDCISSYKISGQRSDIEEACKLYLSLSADKRKWIPAKKRLKNQIIEYVQEIKKEHNSNLEELPEAEETEFSEVTDDEKDESSVVPIDVEAENDPENLPENN